MTQNFSKSRQQAEAAFGRTQTEFFARGRAVEELDSIVEARDAKTSRLRELRMAKEAEAHAATPKTIGSRAKKS